MRVSLKAVFVFIYAVALSCAQTGAPPAPAPPAATSPLAKDAPEAKTLPPVTPAPDTASQGTASPTAAQISPAQQTPPPAPSQASPVVVPELPPVRKPGAAAKPADGKAGAGKPVEKQQPYLIGPLDVLVVKVWGQQNLSGPVDVGPDGTISMPLIGDLKADGLTRDQLKEEIAKHLSDFLNNPEVDVQIGKINSKRYFVYGGVGRQGEFPLIRPTTVMDAMSSVGGFRDFANTKKIRIQRVMPDGTIKEFKFNYKDVSKGKSMEQNILLQNGDRIFVPE